LYIGYLNDSDDSNMATTITTTAAATTTTTRANRFKLRKQQTQITITQKRPRSQRDGDVSSDASTATVKAITQ